VAVARWELQEGETEIMMVRPSMAKLFLLLIVTLGLYLPWFIVRIFQNRATKWIVTNRRLIALSGVFNQSTVSMGLERVQEVHYIRTFWDRIIGTGSLDVVNAGDEEQEHIGFLRKDQEFRDALQQAIDMRQAELRESSGSRDGL
jgi:uncharacterized membrane protein YdbT with pleckstrin-like domain